MYKFGVRLAPAHWAHAESILDSTADEVSKKKAIEEWLSVTAKLLSEDPAFSGRSSEAIVKAFGRIILYHAKRPDLLRLSYIRIQLKRGSHGTILKWIDELMKEAVESVTSSPFIAGVPEEIQDIAAEMITKLWKAAQAERERPTLTEERKELEKCIARLESQSREIESLKRERESLSERIASLSDDLGSCQIELTVAKEQVIAHREESSAQNQRFNATLEQLRRSMDLADEQKRNALIEIDRARTMNRPLEEENKKLRKQLAEESVLTEQYRAKANSLELKVAELESSLKKDR